MMNKAGKLCILFLFLIGGLSGCGSPSEQEYEEDVSLNISGSEEDDSLDAQDTGDIYKWD